MRCGCAPSAGGWKRQKWLPGTDGEGAPVCWPAWGCLPAPPVERQAGGRQRGLSPSLGGLSTRPRGSSGSSPHGPRGETEAQSGESSAQGLTVRGCSKPRALWLDEPLAGLLPPLPSRQATSGKPGPRGLEAQTVFGSPQIHKGAGRPPVRALRVSDTRLCGPRGGRGLTRAHAIPACRTLRLGPARVPRDGASGVRCSGVRVASGSAWLPGAPRAEGGGHWNPFWVTGRVSGARGRGLSAALQRRDLRQPGCLP